MTDSVRPRSDRRDMPSFQAEADALARILALAFDAARNLETPAEPDVVRLLVEAMEHAWLEGADSR